LGLEIQRISNSFLFYYLFLIFMRSKRGFQMSIGFIVTLILTVVVFTGSLYFLRQFYTSTTEFEEQIGRDTEAQIRSLVSQGKIVAVPINRATAPRGQAATFWLGISNVLTDGTDNFEYVASFNKAFDETEDELEDASPDHINKDWVIYNPGPHTIQQGEFESFPIRIEPGNNMAGDVRTVTGTYVFNVCVYKAGTQDRAQAVEYCSSPDSGFQDALYTQKVYKIFVQVP
jgi:hypothetical protein